jgi:hypothetical protein
VCRPYVTPLNGAALRIAARMPPSTCPAEPFCNEQAGHIMACGRFRGLGSADDMDAGGMHSWMRAATACSRRSALRRCGRSRRWAGGLLGAGRLTCSWRQGGPAVEELNVQLRGVERPYDLGETSEYAREGVHE